MKLSELSVDRPISTIVGVLLVGLFGAVALVLLPIQMKPNIDKPIIRIQTTYPGAAPPEVEQQITDIFEEKINSIEGLRKLSSSSSESNSTITLEFDWGVNRDAKFIDVIEKVNQLENLPEQAEKSVITAVSGVDEEKIMWIMMQSEVFSVEEMTYFATNEIKDALAKVEGVGEILVFGGKEREISVLLDPKSVVAHSLTVEKIRHILLAENRNVRGGYIDEGKTRFNVRTLGELTTINQLENIVVVSNKSGTTYLKDIAIVEDTYERITSVVRGNAQPMIALGISRKIGANVVRVTKRLDKAIIKLNKRFAEITYKGQSGNIELVKAYDESAYIWESISFVSQNLVFGSLLAALVLIFFLRSFRSVLIVSIVIPICFITNFVFLLILDRSVNIISLAGIAFAVGMTVDNAIVVIENIYRHLEMGKSKKQAALDGCKEVWGAVFASSLTTMAVFLPILYIQEETGELFKDIALTISCSVAISLVLSLTVVVMLSSRFLHSSPKQNTLAIPDRKRYFSKVDFAIIYCFRLLKYNFFKVVDLFGQGVAFVFNTGTRFVTGKYLAKFPTINNSFTMIAFKMIIVVLLMAPAIIIALIYVPPLEYLPTGNRNMVLVVYKVPPGTNIEKSSEISYGMEQKILNLTFDPAQSDDPDNKIVEQMFGIVSGEFKIIGAIFKPKFARAPVSEIPFPINPMTQKPFRSSMDYLAFLLTGATYGTAGTEWAFAIRPGLFEFEGKSFEVEIRGPDIEKLQQLSGELIKEINALGKEKGFGNVRQDFEIGLPEIRVEIDREKAAELGINVSEVAELIEVLIAGRKTGKFRDGSDEVDIVVRAQESTVDNIDNLKSVIFLIPQKGSTLIDNVTNIYTADGPTRINHKERSRAITLTVNLPENKPLQQAIEEVRESCVDPIRGKIPAEYSIEIAGTASDLERTQKNFIPTFLLSVIIIYLLMASLFESFIYPFIIMISVPLAISGSILAIHINSVPMDMLTVMGFIILCGIVVNNAILVVHQALNFEREGMEHTEAICESVKTRLRPAFMSTVTTVFGLLPMCIKGSPGSELYNGLGTAITGGLIFSTFFTLILVPCLLSLMWDIRDILNRIGSYFGRGRIVSQDFVNQDPRATSHEPGATSYEPDNRE